MSANISAIGQRSTQDRSADEQMMRPKGKSRACAQAISTYLDLRLGSVQKSVTGRDPAPCQI